MRAALRQHDRGISITAGRRITTAEFLERWLAGKHDIRPMTFKRYRDLVHLHIIPTVGSIPLERLSPQDVDAMLKAKSREGLSDRTVHHIRSCLRGALHKAEADGLVARNAAGLSTAWKVDAEEHSVLDPDQAKTLLTAARGHEHEALVTVALALGLRQGEALGLQWSDVDLDAPSLRVGRALQRLNGRLQLVAPKTKLSRRMITLPTAVADALREHRVRQVQARLMAGSAWIDSDFVFTNRRGGPLQGGLVTESFQRLVEDAGLPRMRFHDLRHSCATLMLVQGVPARVVMETLGHSTITLTMNTYSHVMPSLKREAADAMDRILGGAKPGG